MAHRFLAMGYDYVSDGLRLVGLVPKAHWQFFQGMNHYSHGRHYSPRRASVYRVDSNPQPRLLHAGLRKVFDQRRNFSI